MTTSVELEKGPATQVEEAECTRGGKMYRPSVDIIEKPDELVLLADMPGVCSDHIDVRFEKGTLTIHGRVKDRQPENTEYLLREYGIGDFYRTFQVNETINAEHISAEFSNGVLTLHLPKVEAVKPRKIQVSVK
jgi:HSP20 family molecular chaperone IbpA